MEDLCILVSHPHNDGIGINLAYFVKQEKTKKGFTDTRGASNGPSLLGTRYCFPKQIVNFSDIEMPSINFGAHPIDSFLKSNPILSGGNVTLTK